jgi:hypothetical protein
LPNLFADNPTQVTSRSELEADLAQDLKLFVLSGIAMPEWVITDDGHLYREEVVVNLRKTVLAVEEATVSVGLASIENDHSAFLFAADDAVIDVDSNTQELLIRVQCSQRGDVNKLHRFSYQVVAKVTTQVTGISGRILWPTSLLSGPPITSSAAAQAFRISANLIQNVSGGGPFGSTTTTQLAFGVTEKVQVIGDQVVVPYEIAGAPYGTPITVLVDINPSFPISAYAQQITGPSPITLTTTNPSVTGIDFEIFENRRPK